MQQRKWWAWAAGGVGLGVLAMVAVFGGRHQPDTAAEQGLSIVSYSVGASMRADEDAAAFGIQPGSTLAPVYVQVDNSSDKALAAVIRIDGYSRGAVVATGLAPGVALPHSRSTITGQINLAPGVTTERTTASVYSAVPEDD